MPKAYTQITQNGQITAPVGSKTTLMNGGSFGNVHFADAATFEALNAQPANVRRAVLDAMHALKPGESKSLSAGTYLVEIPFNSTVIVCVES